jgi:fluoride exporter
MITLGLVLAGGAAGAVLRLLLDTAATARYGRRLPWGILAANVLGSLLLGLLHDTAPTWLVALAGTGFCGGLTTYSTLAADTVRLAGEAAHARRTQSDGESGPGCRRGRAGLVAGVVDARRVTGRGTVGACR